MYNSYSEYKNDYPYGDFDEYQSMNFRLTTKSMQEEDGFIEAITIYAKRLNLTDQELAERFNVSVFTLQRWKANESLPFAHIQREITLWINCLRIETLICNQCDKKKIPTEMNNLTCNLCCGK
jgi:DNA-binding transcriptional regulator YiaG